MSDLIPNRRVTPQQRANRSQRKFNRISNIRPKDRTQGQKQFFRGYRRDMRQGNTGPQIFGTNGLDLGFAFNEWASTADRNLTSTYDDLLATLARDRQLNENDRAAYLDRFGVMRDRALRNEPFMFSRRGLETSGIRDRMQAEFAADRNYQLDRAQRGFDSRADDLDDQQLLGRRALEQGLQGIELERFRRQQIAASILGMQ